MMKIDERQGMRFGSDPEVFVKDGNGKILPSWKFLPKKDAPLLSERDNSVKAYSDGFQAETANPSSYCIAVETWYVKEGLKTIINAAKKVDANAKLTLENTPEIDDEVLENEAMENLILGCEPSLNIHGLMGEFAGDPRMLKYRFAGGHGHIGFANLDFAKPNYYNYVKMLDKVAGIYFVGAAANIDTPIRRRYYGQPGEHRTPAHGLEYRCLSNAWLSHPGFTHIMFMLLRGSVAAVDAGLLDAMVVGDELLVETIQGGDVKTARQIIQANEEMLKAILACGMRYLYTKEAGDLFIQAGLNGIESVVKDPEAIETNWHLDDVERGNLSWAETTTKYHQHNSPVQ